MEPVEPRIAMRFTVRVLARPRAPRARSPADSVD